MRKTSNVNQMFKAFADETRLRILALLSEKQELCVCDVIEILKQPQPKISRHLAYLRKAGLVQTRRDGTWIYYLLTEPLTPFHKKLLGCLSSCFGDVGVMKKDRQLIAKQNGKVKCC